MDGTTSWEDGGSGGGLTWNTVSGASQTIVPGNGYFVDSGVLTTFTTPSGGTIGDTFEIRCKAGSGSSFRIVQVGIFDQMQVVTYVTGPNNGIVSSTSDGDCISFTLLTSTLWVAGFINGNLNVTG